MAQLNVNLTPAFERSLTRFMRLRKIKTKSEAIRVAVEEALAATIKRGAAADFSSWVGIAASKPMNPEPRFPNHDSLWS